MLNLTYRASLLAFFFSIAAFAQDAPTSAPAIPQTSPKAAYDAAMHPLLVTRGSIGNWSDTEIAALKVSMAQAAIECSARPAKAFTGEDLVDLAQMCAFGQSFPAVVEAATPYIASTTVSKPRLNQAYAALIDAQLHLKNEPAALITAQAMLSAVPYDALSAEVINEAIAYMQFNNTADAVTLATARQPLLLANLRTLANPPAETTPTSPASQQPQSIHELYADGLAFAALQQLALQPSASSAATVTDLDAALPATLLPDEAAPIAALRRRYAFLGQPLPKLAGTPWPGAEAYLSNPHKLPQIPALHAITALLLFPDWCAQCVRMGSQFPQSVFTVSGHEAYFYGLLAETVAPLPAPKPNTPPPPVTPANSANLLAETPTRTVDPSLLDQFAVTDPPFLILTDAQGIIRVLQPVAEDAVAPRSTVDSAIALIGKQWPLVNPATKPAAAPVRPPQPL